MRWFAAEFALLGHRVVLCDRDADALAEALHYIQCEFEKLTEFDFYSGDETRVRKCICVILWNEATTHHTLEIQHLFRLSTRRVLRVAGRIEESIGADHSHHQRASSCGRRRPGLGGNHRELGGQAKPRGMSVPLPMSNPKCSPPTDLKSMTLPLPISR